MAQYRKGKAQKPRGGGDVAQAILREESHHLAYHTRLISTSTVNSQTEYIMDRLDAFCDSTRTIYPDTTLVVGGYGGCGKSTAVSHWVESRRKAYEKDEFIIYHYAQASAEAAKIPNALERWIWLMGRYMQVSGDFDEIDSLIEGTTSETLLMQRFSRFCTMITEGYRGSSGPGGYKGFSSESSVVKSSISESSRDKQRLVIVVDGVDIMRVQDGSESLRWLPIKLPKNVTIILTSTMHGPMNARHEYNHKKLEVPKCFLKLPPNSQELLCFHVNKLNMYHRPEIEGVRQGTFAECWRRKYFFVEMRPLDLLMQRQFVVNALQKREESYNNTVYSARFLEKVIARPSFRHTKAKHEVLKLCNENGPTSSPAVLSLLVDAACTGTAEGVKEDVLSCFEVAKQYWDKNGTRFTRACSDALYRAYFNVLKKSFENGCTKFKLERLNKKQFPAGAPDPNFKASIFECAIFLLGTSRFGLQPAEWWRCLSLLNPEWGGDDLKPAHALINWLVRLQYVRIEYHHRDPNNSISNIEVKPSNSASKDLASVFSNAHGGISLFQALKLKKMAKKEKEKTANHLPWWYLPVRGGETEWCQQLHSILPESRFWHALCSGNDRNNLLYSCHGTMTRFFEHYENKQRAVEEIVSHGLYSKDYILLKRLTTQIHWFLVFWRSEGGVNRRDMVSLWCAGDPRTPQSALEYRFDAVKEFVSTTEIWWERVRLARNGDQDAADSHTSQVLKDISRFFNACVVLYQNRYNKKGVVVPEYDRKNFAPETVAMKLLVNGVNDSLFPALRARSRSMSGTGEDYMLTDMLTPGHTGLNRSSIRRDYEFDEGSIYTADAARYALWYRRWNWVQLPHILMLRAAKLAGHYKSYASTAIETSSEEEYNSDNKSVSKKTKQPSRFPSISPMKKKSEKISDGFTKKNSNALSESTTSITNDGVPEAQEEHDKKDIIDILTEKLLKSGSGKKITVQDMTNNPLDVLSFGKYGAADEEKKMISALNDAVLEKQRQLSRAIVKKQHLKKKLQAAIDELRDLDLVGRGMTFNPDTGEVVSPAIVHCEAKLKAMEDKNLIQEWTQNYLMRLLHLCSVTRPDNNEYVENTGNHIQELNSQIQLGLRKLTAINIENETLRNETLPSYRKALNEFKMLNKTALEKIEIGVEDLYREQDRRLDKIKAKQKFLKDAEIARKARLNQELQEKQTRQIMMQMGLGLARGKKSSKEGIRKKLAQVKSLIPHLIIKLENAGIEEPSEILPKLLNQGRSFVTMERSSKDLEKRKIELQHELGEMKRKLHELEFGPIQERVNTPETSEVDTGLKHRRGAKRMSTSLFQAQSRGLQTPEVKANQLVTRKQELLTFESKLSSASSKAFNGRQRLINSIAYVRNLEQGLLHLATIVNSEDAKNILQAEGSQSDSSSSDSDSDDAKYVRKKVASTPFREKSKNGFHPSRRGKHALSKILSKIKQLVKDTEDHEHKVKRNQRRSVITGELLPDKHGKKNKMKKVAKEEPRVERTYYSDGIPVPLRPVSRIVKFRQHTIDLASQKLDFQEGVEEREFWLQAVYDGGANAARRKLQEKIRKEQERKEKVRLQKLRMAREEKERREAEEKAKLEAIRQEEEEAKRKIEEAARIEMEKEIARKKKLRKKKLGRSRSTYGFSTSQNRGRVGVRKTRETSIPG
jgi:hypothetical protein